MRMSVSFPPLLMQEWINSQPASTRSEISSCAQQAAGLSVPLKLFQTDSALLAKMSSLLLRTTSLATSIILVAMAAISIMPGNIYRITEPSLNSAGHTHQEVVVIQAPAGPLAPLLDRPGRNISANPALLFTQQLLMPSRQRSTTTAPLKLDSSCMRISIIT